MDFNIEVNSRPVDVMEGETLLTALRRNGISIPTLCHMNRLTPSGACRLCVVEVEGKRDLITSCSYPVEPGMKVLTNSPRVIKARKSLVELLLSNHPDDCLYCQRNGNCELQWLAEEMNIKERKYFGEKNKYFPDQSAASVARDPAKCILCSRCVRICEEIQLVTAIDFINRSNRTIVSSAFNKGLNSSTCINCGQCIMVCPTAALVEISHLERVQAAIDHPEKKVACLISPSLLISVAEELALKPSYHLQGQIIAALKKCGASMVFDLGSGCDLNVKYEANKLIESLKLHNGITMISSCCPAWVKYVEICRPEWEPYLSVVKSPQQLLGSVLKFDKRPTDTTDRSSLFTVTIMPCVAAKYEASREEMTHKGISEIDAVLSVREFFRLIRSNGIDLLNLESVPFDTSFPDSSAAAYKLGYAGGKAEAVALEAFLQAGGKKERFKYIVPKNIAARKETKVVIDDKSIGFAWVSGIADADEYIASLIQNKRTDIHYIEVMACQGGCAGGGGQPIDRNPAKTRNRKKLCQEMERQSQLKSPSALLPSGRSL